MADPHSAGAGAAAESPRPKVLYVMGAGRSGSTILGVALGNCENVFFAGELDRWLARAGVPRANRSGAELWSAVRDGAQDPSAPLEGKSTYLERSSALLDPRKWAARRRLRRTYRSVSEQLYLSIARATGATHVVDSSHYPLRARELQALSGIDLYLLMLVRDPQSVAASLGRSDVPERRFGLLAANAYMALTHALSIWVFMRHRRDRRLFIRHEDFLASPQEVLRQILQRCDCDAQIPDLGALRTGAPFHGNRLIDSELVSLGAPASTPAPGSRVTALLQLPWRMSFSRLRPAVRVSRSERRDASPAARV